MKKLLVMFFAASMFAACGEASSEAAEDKGGDATPPAPVDKPVEKDSTSTENNESDSLDIQISDSL